MGGRNSKAPLYNKTSSNKNANNLSSDYGYLSTIFLFKIFF